MTVDDFPTTIAFDCSDYYPPQATVSLAETNLLIPNSPSSVESVKDEEDKKPTRKRKSWGQELPTPKTNLPPRKRAKTEDEKEQRRIERVLRNRQAAQSSRERKRLEVEKLEVEKEAIEHQNQVLRERLMAVEHEKFKLSQKLVRMKAAMRQTRGEESIQSILSSAASSPSPRALIPLEGHIKKELDDYPFALPTPRYSTATASSTFSTPASTPYSRSSTPIGFSFNNISSSSDLTQHPAAMLCGLQCQSEAASLIPAPSPTLDEVRRRAHVTILWKLLCLILISTIYSRILKPLRMIMISLPMGSHLSNTILRTPAIFLLIKWLISRPANLTPPTVISPNPLTPTTMTTPNSARTPTNSLAPSSTTSKPTLSISLLRNLLVCSPALARPLKGATDRAMRPKTSSKLNGNSSDGVPKREDGEMINVCGVGKEKKSRIDKPLSSEINHFRRDIKKKRRKSHCTNRLKRITVIAQGV